MNIDRLCGELRACEAKADANLRLDASRLEARSLRAAAGLAMRRLRWWLWVEVALNVLATIWLGDFLASHSREPRFLVAAIPLHAMAIAQLVFGVRQIDRLRRADFGGAVVALQRELETLRIGRIRMTKWTVLLAPLLWIPLLVVVLEGVFGLDAYAMFDRAWLVTNVVIGVAFIPAMHWTAKRLVHRFEGSPRFRSLLRAIAGYSLSSAEAFLDDAARLESGT
jgi:hypothetical protein